MSERNNALPLAQVDDKHPLPVLKMHITHCNPCLNAVIYFNKRGTPLIIHVKVNLLVKGSTAQPVETAA